jgi:hypothetical protein
VVALLAPAGVVVLVWAILVEATALTSGDEIPMVTQLRVDRFPSAELISNTLAFVPPSKQTQIAVLGEPIVGVWDVVIGAALVSGGVAAVAARISPALVRMGGLTLLALLLSGPLFVVANYVLTRFYFPIPPRYGLSLVPLLVALLVASLPTRGARATLVAGAAAGVLTVLYGLVA